MKKIEWNKKIEVGNFEIDSEHKVFVRIIQKIRNAVERDTNKQHVERLIVELLKYAEFHFCSEENVMFEIEYPDIIDHKYEHEKLLAELRNLIFAFGLDKQDVHELVNFLIKWFLNHTSIEDMKLARFFKKSAKT